MTATLDIDHPWPGPDSFRAQDAAYFRGRENEIKQLSQLIHRARSVVLYGASGLGKSSLINAGLVPRLSVTEYFAVPIRISYVASAPSVSEQLQSRILDSRSGPGMPRPRPQRTAWELLHLRAEPIEGPQPLLIFDQFEELFTIGARTPQAAQLIEELRALIEGTPPTAVRERLERNPEEARSLSLQRKGHRILISIREDFLYGLEALRAQIPSIIHNRIRIGPLSGAMALEVVLQRPSGATAAPDSGTGTPLVTPEVAELIVRTVASTASDNRPLDTLEVEPALLSILCMELARRRAPRAPITRELVSGSRADIISSFYERSLSGVPATVRSYIEDELVTTTGYRTSVVLAEALAMPGFTSDVLSNLVNTRLLRVIERPTGKWLEITHDILTEIACNSRKLRQERQRAQEAREQERRDRAVRELRRTRRMAAVLVLMLAASVSASVLAVHSWKLAEHAARDANEARQQEQRQRDNAERAMQDAVTQKAIAERSLAALQATLSPPKPDPPPLQVSLSPPQADPTPPKADPTPPKADPTPPKADPTPPKADPTPPKADPTPPKADPTPQIKVRRPLSKAKLSPPQLNLSPPAREAGVQAQQAPSNVSQIKFRVEARALGYKDSLNREIYEFSIYPQRDTIPATGISSIVYYAAHPSFRDKLMTSDPEHGFRAKYTGWGCVRQMTALIGLAAPSESSTAIVFDMCAAMGGQLE
jgi:hypothetical protein